MPEVTEILDRKRFGDIRFRSIKAIRAWIDMLVAAETNDLPECRRLYGEIRDHTVATSDLIKAIRAEVAK